MRSPSPPKNSEQSSRKRMTLVKERPVESVNDNNKDKKPHVSLKVFIPIDNVIPKFDSLKELETKILRSRQNN